MNAARLLQHFERISAAPDAVPRLRQFILDLAVRGKLVEQDPDDEPAFELLKRIQTEKVRLVKAGEIRMERPLPLVEEDEAPYSPPTGWEWVRIRQVTSDRGQMTPDKDFTYIDVTAINKEVGCVADAKVLSPLDAPSRARKMVRTGDVLYSCVRPYLLNIAVIEKDIVPSPIASTAFAVLNGFGLVLSKYLWIALRSPFMVECVEAKMRGQAYPAINDSDFAILPLPLPPLAEQHRIVAKVDELMALCDRLEVAQAERENRRDRLVAASLNGLNSGADDYTFRKHARFHLNHLSRLTSRIEHIKQLRQTILNLAVRGCLVPQDPNAEPAAALLKRIQEWRAKAIQRKEIREPRKPLMIITEDDFPYERPSGWEWVRLGNFMCIQSGDGLTAENMKDGDIPVFGGNGINGHHNSYNVDEPTVVIGRVGYYCGSIHVTPPRAWVTDNAFITRFDQESIYQRFLVLVLIGTNLKENEKATAQPVISGSKIYPVVVGLPPLAEQHRIVAKVDELMILCDQLEAQLTTTQTESRRLLEAILDNALSGNGEILQDVLQT